MEQKSKKKQKMPMQEKETTLGVILMLLAGIIIIGLSFVAGYFISKNHQADKASNLTEYLFVMAGDMEVSDDNTLTIKNDTIEWFTDRPQRDAGRMDTESFIDVWELGDFSDVPPNAAFSNLSVVVELSNPKLVDDGISFNYNTISGKLQKGPILNSSLYIDAVPTTVNGQITDAVTQTSSDDGICYFDQAPWQVAGIVKYIKDDMTCAQRDEIMSELFNQVELKDYSFSINITVDYPQPDTQWLCAGAVLPFSDVSPWQLNDNTNCDPVDETLKQDYGFLIVGQTSLYNSSN